MHRVVLSIMREGEPGEIDVDIPVEIAVHSLLSLLTVTFGWSVEGMELVSDPPGRILKQDEILANAGVWDGSRLLLQLHGATSRVVAPLVSDSLPEEPGPLIGWVPLDLGWPSNPHADTDQASDESSPYVWKELD